MEYTIGNWTVKSLTTDSTETSKNLAIADLSYSKDFTVAKTTDEEVMLNNTTGATLEPVENVRYGRTRITDVYAGTDIPLPNRIAAKNGVRTLCEVRCNLSAVNSVSGDELLLPLKGWVCLQVPTASMITPQAIEYMLSRAVSACLNEGSTDGARVTEVARGDLSPL